MPFSPSHIVRRNAAPTGGPVQGQNPPCESPPQPGVRPAVLDCIHPIHAIASVAAPRAPRPAGGASRRSGRMVAAVSRGRTGTWMPRRTPLIALTALLFFVGAAPAAAQLRTLTFTLASGATVTTTMDVPAGAASPRSSRPGVTEPVVSVQDHGAVTTDADAVGDAGRARPDAHPAAQAREAESGQADDDPRPGRQPERRRRAIAAAAQDKAGQGQQGAGPLARARTRRDKERAKAEPKDTDAGRDAGPARPAGRRPPRRPSGSLPAPGAVGVPNFFIDRFRIPPFLLPIYQAAGIQYGVRWEILAAINEIETDYGRNLNVSSAGALGWMQFMPSELGGLRRRRQRRRRQGPLQPGRRDLRRRPLPARRGRRAGPLARDLRLQPRAVVRRRRAPARTRHRRAAGQPRRLADRAHAGPLPGLRPLDLRRRRLRA